KVAKNFINFQASKMGIMSLRADDAQIQLKSIDDRNYYYVVNFQDSGFVIVSADDLAYPVLAYSFEGNLDLNNIAPATRYWLGEFEQQFDILYDMNLTRETESIKQLWVDILQNNLSVERGENAPKAVNTLLETRWNQGNPYNLYCPPHPKGPAGRTYAGCVATAMAQVMKYYNYPDMGQGSKTYFWGDYFTIDFGETTYRWDEMTRSANINSRDAIAELMFHCGVSVNMNFGYDGSGTQLEYAITAMKQYFKYRADSYFENKDLVEDAEWKYMLKYELDMARPILYRGTSDDGGRHAFVCDGYQDTSYFHFNWGWGGMGDGFFHLGDINPVIDFKWWQGAIFNLNPYAAKYCDNIVFDQAEWTITDGSGPNYYWNDTECTWLIQPESGDEIHINFLEFATEPNKDILYIYDGADDTAPLIGEFSGFSIPNNIVSTGNKVFLKFVTDESVQNLGWKLKYSTRLTDVDENLNSNINIYPNPASDNIIITHGVECKSLEIIDLLGVQVLNFECNSNQTNIDVSNLAKGIYTIRITYDNEIVIKNFVVQ
ncbi:MAG: T9SS type A sorting domain-containing protein, partial [Bacteroidales bacterium]|nr:T9SS type A sorting domain-containing protein [Bacteroidales bacterium]